MALPTTLVLEMNPAGDDTNGGGYDSTAGTTDFSISPFPAVAVADAVTNGTTRIVSATAAFTAQMVGNLLYIADGTGSIAADWYLVDSFTSSTQIDVDRATGLSTGIDATLNLGGALASPGGLGAILAAHSVAGWVAHVRKGGDYTFSTTSINVSGGPISLTRQKKLRIVGYETDREDGLAKPEFNAGAQNVADMLFLRGSTSEPVILENLRVDCNSQANANGFRAFSAINNETTCIDCEAVAADGIGKSGFSVIQAEKCKSIDCTAGFLNAAASHCIDEGSTTGFSSTTTFECVADGSAVGFAVFGGQVLRNCSSYNCSGDGFTANNKGMAINCYAGNSGGWGFNGIATLINCAGFLNSSGNVNNSDFNFDFVTITDGQPLTLPGSDDFEPNATADRGALMRGAGDVVPGQTENRDIGAVQHADPAGGGILVHPGTSGGARG